MHSILNGQKNEKKRTENWLEMANKISFFNLYESLFSKALNKCLYHTFRAGVSSIPADTSHRCNARFVPIHWNLVSNRILPDIRWTWRHFPLTHSMHSIGHLHWSLTFGRTADGASLDGNWLPDSGADVACDVLDSCVECSQTRTSLMVVVVVASCCFHRNFFLLCAFV